ncbi:Sodium/calcium exchanger 2 [Pteropus alecto]|uniref:Sodium/calcium exchanger 2 n=1 Tax=Pteropus alecto TaxID=9402 RepID=L5L4E6_PTEAL|nr:Sodium/calcium exchanger 2 [Pteropus alecto]
MAPLALVGVALLLGVPPCSGAATPTPSLPPPPANDSDASTGVCQGSNRCQPGVLLPVWEPDDPSLGDKAARAVVYFVAMVYMFLGVSIIADRFMASIEVITSKEKEITITKANGETSVGTVRIWNETVSNLTLMALGSSAPEILLSVIEVCGHNFQAGELGPGTIVGSAAFNMFVVIAVCIYVIPAGESRKIKHLRVFFVTASWSIFAYVWLYLILAVFSPGVVQVWEALLTLVFFPVCVVFAWMADKRLLFYKYVYKRYRTDPRSGIIIGAEGDPPKSIELDGTFDEDDGASHIFFEPSLYHCLENCGSVLLSVTCEGGEGNSTFYVDYRTEDGSAKAGSDYEYRKTLQVKIVDDEEYEKKDNFFIELGQPQWLKRGISALLLNQGDGDRKLTAEEEEARRIAEMGKPVLGENCRLEVIIEESYDFKNTVDKLIKKTNLALVIGTHSWREQFLEAITVSAGDEEEEEDGSREERLPSCFDYVMHFLTVFWKVLFACVPPTEYCHGWACFGVCILVIGLLTALIGDLASHFGCTVGLKDSVNAVVFVALGTSIPGNPRGEPCGAGVSEKYGGRAKRN